MPQDSIICHYTRALFQFHVQEKRDRPFFLKVTLKVTGKVTLICIGCD